MHTVAGGDGIAQGGLYRVSLFNFLVSATGVSDFGSRRWRSPFGFVTVAIHVRVGATLLVNMLEVVAVAEACNCQLPILARQS